MRSNSHLLLNVEADLCLGSSGHDGFSLRIAARGVRRNPEMLFQSRFQAPPVISPFEIFWIAGTAGAKIGQLLNGLAESLKPSMLRFAE